MTTMSLISAIRRVAMLGLVALYCLAPMHSALGLAAISGNYYEENSSANCSGSSACQLVFSATPQLVFITDVSCFFGTSQPITYALLGVSDSATPAGGIRRGDFFPPQLLTTGNYLAKFKTSFLFGSGKWPTIYLNMTGASTTNMQCKIVGTLQIP